MSKQIVKYKKLTVFLITLVYYLLVNANSVFAAEITTVTVHEKDGVTTTNYPLTFAIPFKKGAVTTGIVIENQGTDLNTQFDIKRRWDDGSVKHAVISVIIPNITANGTETLTIKAGGVNSDTGALDKMAINATDIESNIALSNISGSGYSGSASASLRNQVNSGDLKYWLKGSVCTEILETAQINNSLDSAWEARFYPGTAFGIRISNSVGNVNALYRGNVYYDLTIQYSESTPETVYAKNSYTHLHGSRWRKVYWLGPEPPETELHYDLEYLISTAMIMPYDTALELNESAIQSEYSTWLSSAHDIDGNGLIMKAFGTTGGRREIGILPRWSAMWLLSMDNRMKEMAIGNAEIAGHVPNIHYIEGDNTKSRFGRVMSIDDRPGYDQWAHTGVPTAIGDLDKGGWAPDRSHQGSFAYLPYLLTGDYWFLQEVYYWGAMCLAWDEYRRDGGGNHQDFSAGKDGSYGNIYDQERGVAWALRNISDAAAVALDDDPEKNYFTSKLNNNIDWLRLANLPEKHGLHIVRTAREHDYLEGDWTIQIAPWQHDFIVLVLSDIIRKETAPVSETKELRDYLGEFTIGRFTNHPNFNKWDGAGYWWPLVNKQGEYYPSGSWSEYWADNVIYDNEFRHQGLPHSDYTRYDYSYSYLAIAIATLAPISYLPGGSEAFNFARQNLSTSQYQTDPTWAIVPAEVSVVDSVSPAPPINLNIY